MNKYFYRLLRQRRKKLGLTVRELAAKSHLGISEVNRVELGRRNPSLNFLINIAKPLGFGICELLTIYGVPFDDAIPAKDANSSLVNTPSQNIEITTTEEFFRELDTLISRSPKLFPSLKYLY